ILPDTPVRRRTMGVAPELRTRSSSNRAPVAHAVALVAWLAAGCQAPRNEPVDAEATDTIGLRSDAGGGGGAETVVRTGETDGPASCDQQACSLASKDGCCPAACTASSDADCSASCGHSVLEPNETCDPPSSCPR